MPAPGVTAIDHVSVLITDLAKARWFYRDVLGLRSPRHFALRVPDARAAREHFRAHGVETQETGPIPHCDRFFVGDPDGNRIELIQWIEPYNPAASGAANLD
jgi:glyoxylase I family protein